MVDSYEGPCSQQQQQQPSPAFLRHGTSFYLISRSRPLHPLFFVIILFKNREKTYICIKRL
jgi:hypothetical protein